MSGSGRIGRRRRRQCRPKIAVLDYGIGNLRSAEKALQHVGAAARLVTDPAEVEAADAVVLPGVEPSGPAPVRSMTAASPPQPAAPSGRASPSWLSASASSSCTKAPTRARECRAWASSPGRWPLLPPSEKHPQMQWNQLEVVGGVPATEARRPCTGWRRSRGCTSCTPTPHPWGPRRWRSVTTAAPWPRWWPAGTCGGRSSTRRSPGAPGWRFVELRRARGVNR